MNLIACCCVFINFLNRYVVNNYLKEIFLNNMQMHYKHYISMHTIMVLYKNKTQRDIFVKEMSTRTRTHIVINSFMQYF